jgi:hypothetical protein
MLHQYEITVNPLKPSYFLYFIFIIDALGYIVTFTKYLTLYRSSIHPLLILLYTFILPPPPLE